MAMNPTVRGEATAMYLAKLIKPLGIGSPVAPVCGGASLEYADETTLYFICAYWCFPIVV